jgi:outer membrane protein OmpU
MKKGNLLASTALVSAALAMGATSAQALDLRLGGFAALQFGWADNERSGDTSTAAARNIRSNFDIKHDAEVYFLAQGKLDNGLTVGFRAELEMGPGHAGGSGPSDGEGQDSHWDEMYAYMRGNFGEFQIGNTDVATVHSIQPVVTGPIRIFKTHAFRYLQAMGNAGLTNTDVDLGFGDAQTVKYFTPRVAGLQGIVSYMPDQSDWRLNEYERNETTGGRHLVSGVLRFNRKIGDVGVGVSAGYTQAESAPGDSNPKLAGWTAGADIRFGPARLTAAYAFEDLEGSREDQHWGVGLLYSLDKRNDISIGYSDNESKRSATEERGGHTVTAGWRHNMGQGVFLEASVFHGKAQRKVSGTVTQENKGFGAVGGIRLTF